MLLLRPLLVSLSILLLFFNLNTLVQYCSYYSVLFCLFVFLQIKLFMIKLPSYNVWQPSPGFNHCSCLTCVCCNCIPTEWWLLWMISLQLICISLYKKIFNGFSWSHPMQLGQKRFTSYRPWPKTHVLIERKGTLKQWFQESILHL